MKKHLTNTLTAQEPSQTDRTEHLSKARERKRGIEKERGKNEGRETERRDESLERERVERRDKGRKEKAV